MIKNGDEWIKGESKDGEKYRRITSTAAGEIVEEGVFSASEPGALLELIKAQKLQDIKHEARQRIEAYDWRLQRAKERRALGIESDPKNTLEIVEDVMRLREDIREASDRAELEVMQLETEEAVEAFNW
jgi:hypothetical protein